MSFSLVSLTKVSDNIKLRFNDMTIVDGVHVNKMMDED